MSLKKQTGGEKKNKYNAKKVKIDGYTFDSQAEGLYYQKLKEMQQRGEIEGIRIQPKYTLQEKFRMNGKAIRAITYTADFEVRYADGSWEVVDIKGMPTPVFAIKKKMFEFKFGIPLTVLKYTKTYGFQDMETYNREKNERKKIREQKGKRQNERGIFGKD